MIKYGTPVQTGSTGHSRRPTVQKNPERVPRTTQTTGPGTSIFVDMATATPDDAA